MGFPSLLTLLPVDLSSEHPHRIRVGGFDALHIPPPESSALGEMGWRSREDGVGFAFRCGRSGWVGAGHGVCEVEMFRSR